jgi:uncharacterized membrane protein YgdD (TMEM256/DUF423 family)
MNPVVWARLGAVMAGLGVIAGAFGAHYLRERLHLEARALESFETGVRYQIIHALALIAVGLIGLVGRGGRGIDAAGWMFLVGSLVFSGSIYLLALGVGPRKVLGPITPLGGSLLIVGWFVLAWSIASRPGS